MKPMFQTVVIAVSGSEASVNAARYAIVLAKQYRCRLVAINVVDTATLKELLLSRIFVEDESFEYEHSLEENGQRYLNYIEELAARKGVAVEKVMRMFSVPPARAASTAGCAGPSTRPCRFRSGT